MNSGDNSPYFFESASPEDVRREKEKARKLRKTQWWRNQIAKGKCHYCGGSAPAHELTMDHVLPLIRGGRSTKGNVVPACKPCNNRKKHMLPLEWGEFVDILQNPGADAPLENISKIKDEDDG